MSAPTFTMNGKRFVVLPEVEYRRLKQCHSGGKAGDDLGLPALPAKLARGNYPAGEYASGDSARSDSIAKACGIVTDWTGPPCGSMC